MTHLDVVVPESTLAAMRRSPREFVGELKLAAAIHWHQHGLLSQERAAELADLNRRDFIRALARAGHDVFVIDPHSLAQELNDLPPA